MVKSVLKVSRKYICSPLAVLILRWIQVALLFSPIVRPFCIQKTLRCFWLFLRPNNWLEMTLETISGPGYQHFPGWRGRDWEETETLKFSVWLRIPDRERKNLFNWLRKTGKFVFFVRNSISRCALQGWFLNFMLVLNTTPPTECFIASWESESGFWTKFSLSSFSLFRFFCQFLSFQPTSISSCFLRLKSSSQIVLARFMRK